MIQDCTYYYFPLIIICNVLVIVEGYIWNHHCPRFLSARILTLLSGVFFVLLAAYWLVLFWWNKFYKAGRMEAHHKDFTPMAALFWLLTVFYTAVLTALTVEVIQNRDIILSLGRSKQDNFVDCGSNLSPDHSDSDVIHVPNNLMPAVALLILLALLLVYSCILAVLTVLSCVRHRHSSY